MFSSSQISAYRDVSYARSLHPPIPPHPDCGGRKLSQAGREGVAKTSARSFDYRSIRRPARFGDTFLETNRPGEFRRDVPFATEANLVATGKRVER